MEDESMTYLDLVNKAISEFHSDFIGFRDLNEFDGACDHILSLVRDARLLYESRSYNTSIFLSITVIEEVSKVSLGVFRRADGQNVSRSKDPLFSHSAKYQIAANPVVLIGSRLKESLGADVALEIFNKLKSGEFRNLREDSIYFRRSQKGLFLPSNCVSQIDAKRMLLVAIEVFDDTIVGYTNHSYKVGQILNEIYSDIDSK